jgi:hypothetical protein
MDKKPSHQVVKSAKCLKTYFTKENTQMADKCIKMLSPIIH